MTLTLSLDRVIQHTTAHHSSTSIYITNFVEIGKTRRGRMDGHTDRRTLRMALLDRLRAVNLKMTTRYKSGKQTYRKQ